MGRKDGRLNEIGYNNNGERMTIVRYGGVKDIDVQFADGTVVEHKRYDHFKNGEIKNPMFPSVYGVGFIGVGGYKTCDENAKITKCYDAWSNMLMRCYCSKYQDKNPTYKGCTVCSEWHNYQAFGKWDNENYYEIENERMTLDKDILCKRNKVYSPDTCIYVPQSINKLFTKSDNKRGKLPIGVTKYRNKFMAQLSKGDKRIHLVSYDTPEEAFLVYKKAKEEYIKEVAEKYKDKIPQKLYDAMMNYEVEIDD